MAADSTSDAELVLRISGGDRAALGELYDRHSERVAGVAASFRMPAAAVEDLVHDVFLEVWANAYDYAPERGTVLTWLLVRTRSRCLDRIRKSTRRGRLLAASEDRVRPRELTPPSVRGIERSRLRDAIQELDDDLRDVTLRAYFEGASTSEIADALGVPQGTVKSRMRRAREALHVLLTAGDPE